MSSKPERRRTTYRVDQAASPGDSEECVVGPMLCRLLLWSDRDWGRLRPEQRPWKSVRIEGLGWVGAVPVVCLN
jgi:hypothetical protein